MGKIFLSHFNLFGLQKKAVGGRRDARFRSEGELRLPIDFIRNLKSTFFKDAFGQDPIEPFVRINLELLLRGEEGAIHYREGE